MCVYIYRDINIKILVIKSIIICIVNNAFVNIVPQQYNNLISKSDSIQKKKKKREDSPAIFHDRKKGSCVFHKVLCNVDCLLKKKCLFSKKQNFVIPNHYTKPPGLVLYCASSNDLC